MAGVIHVMNIHWNSYSDARNNITAGYIGQKEKLKTILLTIQRAYCAELVIYQKKYNLYHLQLLTYVRYGFSYFGYTQSNMQLAIPTLKL